jgi:hypothetical protein
MSDVMPPDDSESEGFDFETLVDSSKASKSVPREMGSTGLKKSAGILSEEYLHSLLGERGRKIFNEMAMNDPVCSGILHSFEMLLRGARMTVRPAELHMPEGDHAAENFDENVFGETFSGTPQRESQSLDAEAVAAFVEECFDDMSHSFSDFISQVSSMFQYGWSMFEIVYKRRDGDNSRSPGKASKFEDGLIGWRKFAPRAQNSLWEWEFDDTGGVNAFNQFDQFRETSFTAGAKGRNPNNIIRIPIQKGLLFTTTQKSASPEGQSVLRGAYRPWYFKKRLEEIEAIGVERDLAGMPVIYAPAEIFGKDASDDSKALLRILESAVQNIRRDQQDGLVFPREYDEDGNSLYEFELASTGGARQLNTNDIIQRKSTEMAMSVLADFMIIGNSDSGASSFALSQDKTNLFAMAVDAYLQSVAEVLMRHAVPRLLRMNGIDPSLAPILTFENVRAPTLEELGEFVQRLARAGAPFFPDERLQAHLYERAGLPAPSPSAPVAEEEELDENGEPMEDGDPFGMEETEGEVGEPKEVDGGVNDGSLLPEGDGSFSETGTGEPLDATAPDKAVDPTTANDTATRNEDDPKKPKPKKSKPRGSGNGNFDD